MSNANENQMLERLYQSLPKIYRTKDIDNKFQLKRYLEILIGGGLSPVYKDAQGLASLTDIDKVPSQFLPFLASALGFTFPYDLDEQTRRAYIKTAVASYRIKGTKPALEFMIRELTRFHTQVDVDNATKKLDVRLEVDMSRQDFDKVVDKVDFIVKEYAPAYSEYRLINTFIFIEPDWEKTYTDTGLEGSVIKFEPFVEDGITAKAEEYPDFKLNTLESDSFTPVFSYEDIVYKLFSMEDEVNTFPKTEEIVSIDMVYPLVDYVYESSEWFGSNIGLTNQTSTYSGETYFTEILEEFTEIVRTS
jgi:phage tail-like protein